MVARSSHPVIAVVMIVAAVLLLHHHRGATGATTRLSGDVGSVDPTTADVQDVSSSERAASPQFGAEVAPGDRAWIEQAIADARPEARRLIDQIDGLVTFHTGRLPELIMGVTVPHEDGRFDIELNVAQLDGERGIDRSTVVLHELGHVIDYTLIPPATDATLDAGIPSPASCGNEGGPFGACAPARERIADTFAKWALDGAVSAVGAGYEIPAPPSLETWGEPLVRLAVGLPG